MELGLAGKSVLITGGTKGIGLACAKAFAAEGCRVEVASRNRNGYEGNFHAVDLRDGKALAALAQKCGEVDILVNNAGDIPGGTLESVDEAKWRHAWELKVFGYINLSREFFGRMKARRAGVIVNIIGMAAERLPFEYICGATANAGLAAFTKALGKGSLDSGVRVLGVHPPATRTDRLIEIHKAAPRLEGVGGMIEPEQVADMVAFLASRRAGLLSGAVFNLGS